jgi:hypothetical protein
VGRAPCFVSYRVKSIRIRTSSAESQIVLSSGTSQLLATCMKFYGPDELKETINGRGELFLLNKLISGYWKPSNRIHSGSVR